MNKTFAFTLAALAAAGAAHAQQESGRVISSTPVIQQVAVPRQVCNVQQVQVEQPASGAGAAMGAIAGGAMGNAIGDGGGRAVATMIGLVGGALLGNNIERPNTSVQNVQQCTTQTTYENRAVSYNVVYEYAGKQYQVNLPHDPGPSVPLQITPMTSAPPAAPQTFTPAPQGAPMVSAPVYVSPPVQTVITAAPTVVYQAHPSYYYRPYYPPVSLHLGYVRHGGHRHHRHWR